MFSLAEIFHGDDIFGNGFDQESGTAKRQADRKQREWQGSVTLSIAANSQGCDLAGRESRLTAKRK